MQDGVVPRNESYLKNKKGTPGKVWNNFFVIGDAKILQPKILGLIQSTYHADSWEKWRYERTA